MQKLILSVIFDKILIMPIYEYRCKNCNRKFEKLFLTHQNNVFCPACKSEEVEKILSKFRHHRTEKDRISAMDLSKPLTDDFYKDNRNIGLTTKKRLKQMGTNLGDALEEKIEKARSGKILEEIN